MDHPNHTTNPHKHLNFEERMVIQLRLKNGYALYKIASKTAHSILAELDKLKTYFGEQFNQVFKSIMSDNDQKFAELSKIEQESSIKVYFPRPYASCERGTNERHNGLLRRFISKSVAINGYSIDEIAFIED